MKQNINTSIKLIELAATERWIKSLALFYVLKLTFGNSVIYNYRKRMKELSGRFGIAIKTLYSYLDMLNSKGLIEKNKGNSNNLHLTSIKKITAYPIKKNARSQFQLMIIFKLLYANFIINLSKTILGKWPLSGL